MSWKSSEFEKYLSKYLGLIYPLLILFFIFSLLIFLNVVTFNSYLDFSVYYGSRVFVQGLNPYEATISSVYFVYPPSVILLLFPFTLPPIFIAQKIFVIFSIFSFFASILILFRLFKCKIRSPLGIFILILVLNFFPEKFTLGMGQLNNILLLGGVLFLYFYEKNRYYLSGFFLSIPILIKLFPLFVVFFLIFKKKWKILLSFFLTLLSVSILVFILIDQRTNLYFFQVVLPDLVGGIKIDYYNQALSGLLYRQFDNQIVANYLKYIISLLLVIPLGFLIWKIKNNHKISAFCIGTLITLTLIINTYSWQHHFVFLIIPFFIIFFYIKNNNLDIRYYFILGLSYLLISFNLKNPYNFPLLLQSHVFFGILLLYFLELYLLYKIKK